MNLSDRRRLVTELGFKENQWSNLEQYIEFLWAANEELNLISRQQTKTDLVDNHLIDCLLPIQHFPKNLKCVADFGSGGGLPGVVFALNFPETEFILVEKSPKKREFLEQCREIAPNILLSAEIPKNMAKVELVTARAFKPVDVILDLSRHYYNSGGSYFLLKARNQKIEEELQLARKKFKDLEEKIIPLKSPVLDVERNLVLIKKRSIS